VALSLKRGDGHRSDQGAVWDAVQSKLREVGTSSASMAMADAFEEHRARMEALRGAMQYVPGASGVAVALGGKVVSVDLFDRPEACAKVWDRLLSGVVLDALTAAPAGDDVPAGTGVVEALLEKARGADWAPAPAVGEGREYRAEPGEGAHGSALLLGEALVHASVVTG
jgi:hypothetical protein